MKRLHEKRRDVLILRPDNIGDFVLFSGALKHLRRLYSEACLTLAVQPHLLNLVELCPYVDKCISVDQMTWYQKYKKINITGARFLDPMVLKLLRALEKKINNYDQILYPVKSPQVAHLELVRLLEAKEVVGIVGCNLNVLKASCPAKLKAENVFDKHLDVSGLDPWRHELFTTMDFLNTLGCRVGSIDEVWPELWLAEDDIDHIEDFRDSGRTTIGLFPGASSGKRQWGAENFGRFAGLFDKAADFVIFGSSSERDLASDVESQIRRSKKGKILNLAGATTLRGLAKSINSCDLFIGMETSGLHMAIAGGVRTIGIIGGGHYSRFVPWGDPGRNIFLTRTMDCFNCDWSCQYDRIECIQGVSPEEVAEVATRMLN